MKMCPTITDVAFTNFVAIYQLLRHWRNVAHAIKWRLLFQVADITNWRPLYPVLLSVIDFIVTWILIWLLENHKSVASNFCKLTFEKPNCFTCSVHWSAVLTKKNLQTLHCRRITINGTEIFPGDLNVWIYKMEYGPVWTQRHDICVFKSQAFTA